jgi:hypothetical protein
MSMVDDRRASSEEGVVRFPIPAAIRWDDIGL